MLNRPSGIVFDADKYLFIVDYGNNQIIGLAPNGFRCLVGCSNSLGSASNQLNSSRTLSFDSYGNIFVTDWSNRRIEKFIFLDNTLGRYSRIFCQTDLILINVCSIRSSSIV
jgi:streptogramin lyase